MYRQQEKVRGQYTSLDVLYNLDQTSAAMKWSYMYICILYVYSVCT